MGELRPDNKPSDDNGEARGIPGLPPEWGPIVIPDDASELEAEAELVRRELRREARRRRAAQALADREPLPTGVPFMILSIAVLTTLVSLFVMTWGVTSWGRPARQTPQLSQTSMDASEGAAVPTVTRALADVALHDPVGAPVRLGDLFPAVIVLTDGCACEQLVLSIAAKAPPDVTVVAVGHIPPHVNDAPANVRTLGDSLSVIRTDYLPHVSAPPAMATAITVSRDGEIVAVIPAVETADDITFASLGELHAAGRRRA